VQGGGSRGGAPVSKEVEAPVATRKPGSDEPITIKKYANRRLYNTATSSYVTLDDLCTMVKQGQEFNVYDAKTNEDITRSVLTQIIFEEENKGQNLLPIEFLRQLIGYYDDQMQAAVPHYLRSSMDAFSKAQEEMRGRMADVMGGGGHAFKLWEDMARQNVSMFQEVWAETAKRMMPFAGGDAGTGPGGTAPNGAYTPGQPGSEAGQSAAGSKDKDSEIAQLRAEMRAMQDKLQELVDKK